MKWKSRRWNASAENGKLSSLLSSVLWSSSLAQDAVTQEKGLQLVQFISVGRKRIHSRGREATATGRHSKPTIYHWQVGKLRVYICWQCYSTTAHYDMTNFKEKKIFSFKMRLQSHIKASSLGFNGSADCGYLDFDKRAQPLWCLDFVLFINSSLFIFLLSPIQGFKAFLPFMSVRTKHTLISLEPGFFFRFCSEVKQQPPCPPPSADLGKTIRAAILWHREWALKQHLPKRQNKINMSDKVTISVMWLKEKNKRQVKISALTFCSSLWHCWGRINRLVKDGKDIDVCRQTGMLCQHTHTRGRVHTDGQPAASLGWVSCLGCRQGRCQIRDAPQGKRPCTRLHV